MVKVINNYTLVQFLGEGTFGEVYRAVNSTKVGEFAVKVIPVGKLAENPRLEEGMVNQVKILSSMGPCEHIVKYQDYFQTRNNIYFVYEYCNEGTLQDKLKKEKYLPERQALIIFRQLLEAFKVLNRFNIMHRDLKPENIFFSNGKVKLGDFGFCKGLKPGENMAKTMLGSPIYMAPEVLRGQAYTMKADIWSLGVVLYEMLFGNCPYQSSSIASLISTLSQTEFTMPLEKNQVSEKTQSILKKILTKDYFRRISWIELFSIKIDEEGNFVEGDPTPKTPFNSTCRSQSATQGDLSTKINNSNDLPRRSYDSKVKFYSQKYMNVVNQPIHSSSRGTDKKVSIFADNFLEKGNIKHEDNFCPVPAYSSDRSISEGIQPRFSSKRAKLLKKHGECLVLLKQSLTLLQTKTSNSLTESYKTLGQIHLKLKEISAAISVTETDLLDVASLINYQIIQVDRQLIETKQELLRRKLPVPREQKEGRMRTMKSVEDPIFEDIKVPQTYDYCQLCRTEQA